MPGMKLMAYNILEGGLGRIDPLAEVIRQSDADIVVCPEATDGEQFAKLAARLNMDQFRAENPRNPEGAVGLLVRRPLVLREAVNHAPLDKRLTRAALRATIDVPGASTPLVVIGVHLHARETFADEAIRAAELPAVLDIAAPFAEAPHLLAGDFNAHHPDQPIDLATARKKTLERIKGQGNIIPRDIVREILARGYVDTHAATRPPADFGRTLTTAHPALRTDYIFAPRAFAHRVTSCEVMAHPLARFASDHFPVVATFTL